MNAREAPALAEELAALFLRIKGCDILERNYRFLGKEIDIVARKSGRVIFVEVKYRASVRCGRPAEAVDSRKQRHILLAARGFLAERGLESVPCRFDVIEIRLTRGGLSLDVNHIVGAFCAS